MAVTIRQLSKETSEDLVFLEGLIRTFGAEAGEELYNLSLELPTAKLRKEWLSNIISHNVAGLRTYLYYKSKPVGLVEFIENPFYLNKKGQVYPVVLEELVEVNSGQYVEVVYTGGIGSGKTTSALYTTAYQLYLLSCMANPHTTFGLDSSSEIIFIFQSINAKLAKAVNYNRFRSLIEGSPYFNTQFPFDKHIESKLMFPNRIEVVPVSGAETAAIGQNVIGGIIDELNYMAVVENSKASVDGGVYDQAVAVYNSIARRRKSRFMQLGALPGILCLVSSRRYPGQFTDTKEREAKTDKTIYIFDKRMWDVKPDAYRDSKFFRVFKGTETQRARIIEDDEILDEETLKHIDHIPEEYLADFEGDIINALREIAGVATLARYPFLPNVELVNACFGKRASIFSREVVDFVTTQLEIYPELIKDPEKPRLCHIDLGLTSDSAGVCIGYVDHFSTFVRGEEGQDEVLPVIYIDAVLEVKPPKGGEILFYKVRQILYALKELGMNLKWVSFDSFQSVDSMQILRQKGFIVGNTSMDTSLAPYLFTKGALYDNRLEIPSHPKLLHELISLEKDDKRGKVDHTAVSSKDCSDALAGVVYGLTKRRELWVQAGISGHQIPLSVLDVIKKDEVRRQGQIRKESEVVSE